MKVRFDVDYNGSLIVPAVFDGNRCNVEVQMVDSIVECGDDVGAALIAGGQFMAVDEPKRTGKEAKAEAKADVKAEPKSPPAPESAPEPAAEPAIEPEA